MISNKEFKSSDIVVLNDITDGRYRQTEFLSPSTSSTAYKDLNDNIITEKLPESNTKKSRWLGI